MGLIRKKYNFQWIRCHGRMFLKGTVTAGIPKVSVHDHKNTAHDEMLKYGPG
ncbi:hypothetical protein NBRC111894_4101 [Sporolactobacillus inulinus]|uniref:Uncharacterized protein n=1 Tax=Sporolactobacillus inulinus TaxID=2078 RepID=A0A4Y1ZHB4_9BACL|nr:hypothetical protein NBRC111894_4101 [Sporolactobacillus inulinus]